MTDGSEGAYGGGACAVRYRAARCAHGMLGGIVRMIAVSAASDPAVAFRLARLLGSLADRGRMDE